MKIAVMSNKGGVGKTTISISLAYTLARKGFNVALVDLDFHGPNLPIMLGVTEKPEVTADGIRPVVVDGVKVMSIALLLREDDDPVLWSGETKADMVRQMFKSVLWGDVDVFVIDTPPSLGEENVLVLSEADRVVVVTTPHPASVYDVRKILKLLRGKVAAVVVNMSDLFKYEFSLDGVRVIRVPFDEELQRNPRKPLKPIEELAGVLVDGRG